MTRSWFGDDEPEDAWHPDDPVPVLLDNLIRRLFALRAVRVLTDRDLTRLRQLAEDLAYVRDRVG